LLFDPIRDIIEDYLSFRQLLKVYLALESELNAERFVEFPKQLS
jgi:hypothetical protein